MSSSIADIPSLLPAEKSEAGAASIEDIPNLSGDISDIPNLGPDLSTDLPSGPEDAITEEDIARISSETGANPELVRTAAPYFNVSAPNQDAPVARALGFVSEAYGGVPTKLYRMLQSPKEEAALDELAKLAQARKSLGMIGAETAASILLPAGAAGKAAKVAGMGVKGLALGGAAMGAAEGFGRSAASEEIESMLKQAAFTAAGGAAFGLAGKALKKVSAPIAKRITDGLDIDRRVAPIAEEMAAKLAPVRDEIIPGLAKAGPETMDKRAAAFAETINKYNQASPQEQKVLLSQLDRTEAALVKDAAKSPNLQAAVDSAVEAEKSLLKREFASFLKNKTVKGDKVAERVIAKKALNGADAEFMAKEWGRFIESRAAREAVAQGVIEKIPQAEKAMDKIVMFMIDGAKAYGRIDDRLGTKLQPLIDKASTQKHLYSIMLSDDLTRPGAAEAMRIASRLDDAGTSRLYSALDTGVTKGLTAEEKTAFDFFKPAFKESLTKAQKLGLPIEGRENYITYKLTDLDKLPGRIQARANELGLDIKTLPENGRVADWLKELGGDAADEAARKEWVHGISVVTGRKIDTLPQLRNAIARIEDPRLLREAVETRAGMMLQREGKIPEFLREKNVARLYHDWISTAYKHGTMRDIIGELKVGMKKAMAVNDKVAADYISNHIKDLVGVRRGTVAAWTKAKTLQMQQNLRKRAASTSNPVMKKTMESLASFPETSNLFFSQVYPNFLGWSPRAALTNAVQPLLMTVPEMGTAYGMPKVLAGYNSLAKFFAQARTQKHITLDPLMASLMGKKPGEAVAVSSLAELLEKTGTGGRQWDSSMMQALGEGVTASKWYQGASRLSDAHAKLAMSLFGLAENANRFVAAHAGASWIRDLFGGMGPAAKQAAERMLSQADSGYRRAITEAMRKGDQIEATRLGRNYMVGKTIFNYDRATMSEYGRYVGPLFSTFTKWPLAISGDIIREMETKGVPIGGTRALAKYMGPLALLWAADQALSPGKDADNMLEKATAISVGSKGLAGMSPVGVMGDVVSGEAFTPPIVSAIRDVGMGIATADAYKMYKALTDMGAGFIPVFPGLANLVVNMSYVLGDDEKPKGTILNKVVTSMGGDSPDEAVRDFVGELEESVGIERKKR